MPTLGPSTALLRHVCRWCGESIVPEKENVKKQRFCKVSCHDAYHKKAKRMGLEMLDSMDAPVRDK